MATTENTITGSTSAGPHSFTFPYIKADDVKVSKNGSTPYTKVTTFSAEGSVARETEYTQATTSITLGKALVNTDKLRIYRLTSDTNLTATFYPGSAIRSNDLNDNFTQNLYSTQEVVSRYLDAGGSIVVRGDMDVGGYQLTDCGKITSTELDIGTGGIDVDGVTNLDATTVRETLGVTGVSTFTGNIIANGDIDLEGGLDVNGATDLDATTVRETLAVTGVSTFTGAINANGGIDLGGGLDVDGDTTLDAITVRDDLTARGNITAHQDLYIDGTSNLDDVDIDGTVHVQGAITAPGGISGDVTVTGNITSAGYTGAGVVTSGQSTSNTKVYSCAEANTRFFSTDYSTWVSDIHSNIGNVEAVGSDLANNYSSIVDYGDITSNVSTSGVTRVTITDAGSGYSSAPTITFTAPPSGTTATATCTIDGGMIDVITITEAGSGYTSVPTITFSSGSATATATIHNAETSQITTVYNSITNVDNVGTNITNVNTVATDLGLGTTSKITKVYDDLKSGGNGYIEDVATNIGNVNLVGPSITNVNTVATDLDSGSSKITKVYDDLNLGNSSNIKKVADDITKVNTVSTSIDNVDTVATDLGSGSSKITEVYNDLSGDDDIGTVADDIENVKALAVQAVRDNMAALNDTDVLADMAALNDTDVLADMAALGEAAVITDMAALNVTSVLADMSSCRTNISTINSASANATAAEDAKDDAETAKGLAEAAKGLAETAKNGAESAEGNAQAASSSAVSAKAAAELAESNAKTARDLAEDYKDLAASTYSDTAGLYTQQQSIPYNLADNVSTHTEWGDLSSTLGSFANETTDTLLTMAEGSSSYNYGDLP